MELLCIAILILYLYLTWKFFSYLKNQKISDNKINAKEFFNQKRTELQKIIDTKKEKLRDAVKVAKKWEPWKAIDISIIDTWQKSFDDDIENKPWRKFEKEVAEMFYNRWFDVVLWPWIDDNWKDIVIKKSWEIYLVQCKHYYWRKMVSANEVRDFQWAIDLYEKQNNKKVKWIFVTSWNASNKAKATANTLWIELWDKYNRKSKINNL